MPRHKPGGDAPPSDDVGWRFGNQVQDSRHHIQCKFCGHIIKGGITRFKQHLAHMAGQVHGCPSVSKEVREEMMRHLKDKKATKSDAQKRKAELEAQLRGGEGDEEEQREYVDVDEDDSGEEDAQFNMARRASMQSQREWEERQTFRRATGRSGATQYEAGGSSSAAGAGGSGSQHQPRGGFRRAASMREHGVAAGSGRQWINPNAPDARLRAMDPILQKSKSSKQPKINTGTMKKLRDKLGSAVTKFFLYNRIPFHVADSPYTQPMFDIAAEVGKGVKGPTPYEIAEVYMPREHEEVQQWITSFKSTWAERGVTIMCDGWSSITRRHIVNFLVYCNRGTIFHKSVDASNVVSRTAEYYFGLLDAVVDEIGEQYVVQVVTDNEAALKAAGKMLMRKRKHLYWTACSAHCIDLILEDIAKKRSVAKVIEDARSITTFIYNATWLLSLMRRFTEGRELLRPAVTRFATNFIALESIVRYKQQLRAMFSCDEWKQSRWGQARSGTAYDVRKLILGKEFWQKATEICKVHEPLVKVLRLVDGDEKPTMGYIYEAMDRAKLAIKQHCRYYAEYWKIIDHRWSFQLHHDLHAAGYYLNPQFQYGITSSRETEREVLQGMKKVISKLEPDIDNQVRAINQLLLFRDKVETFGTPIAQRAWSQTNPAEWWILHGTCAPELQEIAVKVLSQTTTASNCERNWSTFSLIHTKSRNRLKYQKIQKLVFINYNMRLKLRTMKRRSQEEIDNSFNPITLDYIFDEDDPLDLWLEEREAPVLDGQDNLDWLDLDDDDGGDGGEQTLQRGSSSQQHQPRRTSHSSSSSPARSRSSGSGGLTPPSDDDGDGDGGHGTSGGNGDGVGIGGLDAQGDEHDAIGSFGLHDVRPDYDIGELAPNLPQRPPMDMAHNFGEFGLYDHSYGHTYPYSEPPQQPYPSYGYGYDPYGYRRDSGYTMPGGYVSQPTFSYSPPVHQADERRRDTDLATFTYVFPTGWDDPSEASSSNNRRQSESGSTTPPPPQPARSSLWWW